MKRTTTVFKKETKYTISAILDQKKKKEKKYTHKIPRFSEIKHLHMEKSGLFCFCEYAMNVETIFAFGGSHNGQPQ